MNKQDFTFVPDSLVFYDKINEKYADIMGKVRYMERIINNNDTEYNVYIFYDSDRKELFRSRYEIAGVYNRKSCVWVWAWSIPHYNKNNVRLARKLFIYGSDLDNNKHTILKFQLITSRFNVNSDIQLDILCASASYLVKKKIFVLNQQCLNKAVNGIIDINDADFGTNNEILLLVDLTL